MTSSHEPMVRLTSYLICKVLRPRSTKFANEKKLGQKWPHQGELQGVKNSTLSNFDQIWYIASSIVEVIQVSVIKSGYAPLRAHKGAKRGHLTV